MLRVVAVLIGALALSAPAQGAVAPYGANDAGGFRNVLPPGAAGVGDLGDLVANMAGGALPPHFEDQQPLYDGLLTATPAFDRGAINRLFKDATFGVKAGEEESTTVPRAGVTIVRDAQWGVPHVYGDTRGDVMFGAGYVGAQDRLFLMDVLRHTGRAQLSSFAGGSAGNRAMDRVQWEIAPYTEEDLQRQVDLADDIYGALGKTVVDDVTQYVAGINAYISDARMGAAKMPAEYAALGRITGPEPWKITDVLATASLIGGIFGKGGGSEVASAQIFGAFEQRFGRKKGRRYWKDFRSKDDPEAPTTVRGRFPYLLTDAFAPRGLALPDRGSVKMTPPAPPPPASARRARGTMVGLGAALARAARSGPPHASNWLIVSGRESASGKPIGVLGPQVGYYVPQILMELDLHGPGIDARGAAFPGVNLYVQLGHGRDYAWSATTATSDNVDTFAEVLCQDDFHYRWRGKCREMERLDRHNRWTPTLADQTPEGSETLTVYRTVHGIVYARGTVRGKPVAFARARSTYFHEADSSMGFICLNDPGCTRDARSFQDAAENINFAFNWAYIDAEKIAYYQSGWYPRRSPKTSPDFPILGTGEFDWVGFDPTIYTSQRLTFKEHPRAIDPAYAISWNNKQAPRWGAADDQYGYGSLYRNDLLDRNVAPHVAGAGRITTEQLVQAMGLAATTDLRGALLMGILAKATGKPADADTAKALATLTDWSARGAHRRDLNGDDVYDDDAAVTLMDAWWPRLLTAAFEPALGTDVIKALQTLLPFGDLVEGAGPNPPAFSSGWWTYLDKDLRALFDKKRARKQPGAWARRWCGGGSRAKCRAALQSSLKEALSVSKAKLYGRGDCAGDADAECFDRNASVIAGGFSLPPAPFQNRPTFQQVVEVPARLPRGR